MKRQHNQYGLYAPVGRRTVKPLRGLPARSRRRYVPRALAMTISLLAMTTGTVNACLVDPAEGIARSAQERVASSDLSFIGKVILVKPDASGFQRLTFEIIERYKGPDLQKVEVLYPPLLSYALHIEKPGDKFMVFGKFTDISDTVVSNVLLQEKIARRYGAGI